MIENKAESAPEDSIEGSDRAISAFDAAGYVFQMANEMATLSNRAGLARVAAALELARDLAAEAMAAQARPAQAQLNPAKPDPGNAA